MLFFVIGTHLTACSIRRSALTKTLLTRSAKQVAEWTLRSPVCNISPQRKFESTAVQPLMWLNKQQENTAPLHRCLTELVGS